MLVLIITTTQDAVVVVPTHSLIFDSDAPCQEPIPLGLSTYVYTWLLLARVIFRRDGLETENGLVSFVYYQQLTYLPFSWQNSVTITCI
jgi:hypothetical protein